ncbi:MAG: phage holin family protein [Candidatus Levybacteria bacterium]|nr:phage holin family protein [Candidatus Levybacteria bacterium]
MNLLIQIFINGLAVFLTAYILPGVHVNNFITAIVVGVVLGIINAFVKPLLVLLTLPITIVTLGLFYFVLNALLILLVARIVLGFTVANFWWALLFSLVISLVSWFFHQVAHTK